MKIGLRHAAVLALFALAAFTSAGMPSTVRATAVPSGKQHLESAQPAPAARLSGTTDGAGVSHRGDTTAATSVASPSTWTNLAFPIAPTARASGSMVYDPVRAKTYLFGGEDAFAPRNDTWQWDGAAWVQQCTTAPCNTSLPPARYDQATAFDGGRVQTLLFGGYGCTSGSCSALRDTWAWNGSAWTQLCTSSACQAAAPPARQQAMMTYDAVRDRVILFGGVACTTQSCVWLNDTWTWDGSTWVNVTPTTSPSVRAKGILVFDAARSQVLLFGGYSCATNPCQDFGDTWRWDGAAWTHLAPATSPSPRHAAIGAYNPANGTVTVAGGFCGCYGLDLWTWDGTTWTDRTGSITTSPVAPAPAQPTATTPATAAPASPDRGVDDPSRILAPSEVPVPPAEPQRLPAPLQRDGSASSTPGAPTALAPGGDALPASNAAPWVIVGGYAFSTINPATGLITVFGGYDCNPGCNLSAETWTLDGTHRTIVAHADNPGPRGESPLAYDAARGKSMLFGGARCDPLAPANCYLFNDTWTWDGALWQNVTPPNSPPPRYEATLAFDTATGTTILFGGYGCPPAGSCTDLNDTWSWNGSTWTQLAPAAAPPVRRLAVMTYDTVRNVVVLFGGESCSGSTCTDLSDTWTWNGSGWTNASPAASPPARYSSAMAFDAGHGIAVLFGGYVICAAGVPCYALGDTWLWTGTTWIQAEKSSGVPFTGSYAMAYDATTHTVVMFSGVIWTWNGTDWTSLPSVSTSPSSRYNAGLIYDAADARLVLYGGYQCSTSCTRLGDLWTWTGPTAPGVTGLAPASGSGTGGSSISVSGSDFDTTGGTTFRFGGVPGTNTSCSSSTQCSVTAPPGGCIADVVASTSLQPGARNAADRFTYNPVAGSPWAPLCGAGGPVYYTAATAFDGARGSLLLFGETVVKGYFGVFTVDTWSWNGSTWSQLSPAASPPARLGASMAYDPDTSSVVLFSGFVCTTICGVQSDTWSWDGTTWSQLHPAVSPPAREYASMAYDPVHHVVLLFGGVSCTSTCTYLNDTWAWNGSEWSQRSPASSPTARDNGAMAWDANHGRMVLFGGNPPTCCSYLSDTWTWDGTSWAATAPAHNPAAQFAPAIAYDAVSHRVIQVASDNATWAWDGNDWSVIAAAGASPPGRVSPAMAYDTVRNKVVLFGGRACDTTACVTMADTWTFAGAGVVPPPARFFGSVALNGAPAATGTTLTASVGGAACGTGTVTSGQYVLDLDTSAACSTVGATVSFVVGGITADQTGTIPATPSSVHEDLTAGSSCTTPSKADITSPTGGSITTGMPTFQWGGGACVTQYYLYVGNSFGQADLYSSGALAGSVTFATVSPAIPVDGRTIYVRLWSLVGGNYQAVDHSYVMGACQNPSKADITAPSGGSISTGTPTFQWGSGACVTQYYLYVGSNAGQNDLFSAGPLAGTVTSATVSPAIPVDGRTIFVRLWSLVNGGFQAVDHSYLMGSCANPAKADITAPTEGSITTGSPMFQWGGGACVTQYYLYIGSSSGQNDLYSAGPLPSTTTSATVSPAIPVDGRTIYVRLWSLVNGNYQAVDHSYLMGVCQNPAKADITAPSGGSITSSTPTFQWGGGSCVTQYYLYVGSSAGQSDLFAAGPLAGTVTSATVSPAIPVDGRTIYVRLWSLVNGGFQAVDHSYLMGACQNPSKADISSPAPGTLHGSSQIFSWSGGACVTQYYLFIGSGFGSSDLYSSGPLAGSVISQSVSGLPANGSTVYLRLWSLVNGTYQAVDHSYVSQPAAASVTTIQTSPGSASTVASYSLSVANATGGTFALTFNGQTTAPIPYNATAGSIAAALNALAPMASAGGISASGGPANSTTVVLTCNNPCV